MNIKFTKMHGCGNDYVYIEEKNLNPCTNLSELAKILSHRHKGIGSDGLVIISPSASVDGKMTMYNADGSEGLMCGNAIRCVAKYLYESGVKKNPMAIETASGIKGIELTSENSQITKAKVNMGRPVFTPKDIPVNLPGDIVLNKELEIAGRKFLISCVSMGNPHCVIFSDEPVEFFDLHKYGPLFENHKLFPNKINTEFVNILNKNRLKMRVWERGSGETSACGTGACAIVAVGVGLGYVNKNEDVRVELVGGELTIHYTEDCIYMTGDCVSVFEGEIIV